MRQFPATRPSQNGQALTEFLAVALALVPLFVLVPVLGRLQDQAHTTEMSSRHAAFDHALRAPQAYQPPAAGADGLVPVVAAVPLTVANAFAPGVQSALGLPQAGLFRASVVRVVPNTPSGLRFWAPFDTLDLRIERQTTLWVDGWAASSPQQVDERVRALVPGGDQAAQLLAPTMHTLGAWVELPGQVSSPAFGRLDLWRDLVPADRLRP